MTMVGVQQNLGGVSEWTADEYDPKFGVRRIRRYGRWLRSVSELFCDVDGVVSTPG